MSEGPFGAPRPFAGASMNVRFTFNQAIQYTDLEIEQRLRRNGFPRADVQVEESKRDSRTRVTVLTNSEQFTFALIERLVGQVSNQVDGTISKDKIDVFCT